MNVECITGEFILCLNYSTLPNFSTLNFIEILFRQNRNFLGFS